MVTEPTPEMIDAGAQALCRWFDEEEAHEFSALVLRAALVVDPLRQADTVPVHACPPNGSAVTLCCSKSPFELMANRMTLDPTLVTCNIVSLPRDMLPTIREILRELGYVGYLRRLPDPDGGV